MDRVGIGMAARAVSLLALSSLLLVGCEQGSKPRDPNQPHEGMRTSALTSITFVQVAYATPQSDSTTVSIKYTAAQVAGDLNVVAVGWNDSTAAVSSVTDTSGNAYQLAVGPTSIAGTLSQSIYYAKNIAAAAAGANTVKVTFNRAAAFADIRILEYGGIDPSNPFDGASGATGVSATADSGPITTSNANDLIVGANMTTGATNGAGTGFTSRVITFPDSDIAEDQIVSAVGTYRAQARLSGADWVMQAVAFKGMPSDSQPPSAPSALGATAASSSVVNLSWTASTDNIGVAGYLIERCSGAGCSNFTQIAAPAGTGTTFSDTGRAPATSYSYQVRAKDAAGNLSPYSNVATTTTLPDSTPPSAPSSLVATAVSGSRIDLTWTGSTDDVGVTGYLVERCSGPGCNSFTQIAPPTGTTYSDTGLTAGTSYSYRVRATDATGNLSGYSNVSTAITPAPDTQPPTAPSALNATAGSNSSISLSWTASVDNVAVTGYLVERCQGTGCSNFVQIAAPPGTGTSFTDLGLATSTPYSYQVRATDGSGNLSGYSNVASATTLTTPPAPTIPVFVQGNYATPQSNKTSVPVAFTAAQRSGDFNVVIVGWNDTSARVTSVTDTKGNSYQLAIGPTQRAGLLSQSIYYAMNIAGAPAGANTVTVAFSPAAAYADIRVLEYNGVAHSAAFDVAVGNNGAGSTASSGALTTTAPGDLLVTGAMVTSFINGVGSGYNLRFVTNPDGDMAADRVATNTGAYSATAPMNSGDYVMQLVAFKPAPPDTTPPTVAVTSPSGGATLSGTVNVTVTATDNESGVQALNLLVDGATIGLLAPTSPATFSLNTTQFGNGAHSIGASALNGTRNTGYAPPVSVTFNNPSPGNPAATGLWSGLTSVPIISVHVAQLPSSKILLIDGQSLGWDARVWDTLTNSFVAAPVPANVFCSAHEQMADGRIFVAGGTNGGAHLGLKVGNVFDPVTQSWTVLPNMTSPRWYPTSTELPDGRQLVLAGETSCPGCEALIPEIYNPTTNTWTRLTSASWSFPYYPHVYVLPNGKVLVPSTGEEPIVSQVLDINAQTWTAVGGSTALEGGSSVMYRSWKILKTGKTVDPDDPATPSTAVSYVLDMSQSTPTWRQVASMAFARTYHTLTSLPDGNVLVTGGGPTTAATDTAHAIMQAELWSPTSETWTTLSSMHAPRLYHSEAILLPDARVLIMGGGRFEDDTVPTDQFNAEYFSPPYLFKGPRPVISAAPSNLTYGAGFTVQTPDASRIASVALMRFGSVTHAINMGQRYLSLPFTAGGSSLTITAPPDRNTATPGNYMLFLVDTNGVPSVAAEVRL